MEDRGRLLIFAAAALLGGAASASYVNFESSHVHPIDLTPTAGRLLVVNTPDALLEVFAVQPGGGLTLERSIPVGLEPVTVAARTDGEAWVVNNLSDTVSIVDLAQGVITRTLFVGDEPTDVVFAAGKAFVSVSQEDAVKVYNLANLNAAPSVVPLFGRDVRALGVSGNGQKVYAVVLRSGNRTTVVNAKIAFGNNANLNVARLTALGLRDMKCDAPPGPPLYPPLPAGIERNPELTDPPASANPLQFPKVGLIVEWDAGTGRWEDEAAGDWSHCLPYRLPDRDLFIIDAATLAVSSVSGLGTSLFDVTVHPTSGKIYVPNTEARNFVRFEHPLGVQGHMVDNRMSIVDPAAGNSVTVVDLNAHIDRGSDPAANIAERLASISQPGMLVFKANGTAGYLVAIGSRKIFRVDGGCTAGSCIFGPARAEPAAVEVGEGPTGVALHEGKDRLYVLNRISHSIAVVQASSMTKLEEIPLHDPSSQATREGRRFLYDAVDTSGHGDAACSSCHVSGDMDGLAWDLGNPEGDLVPYTTAFDNVRFVVPQNGEPVECDAESCAAHDGFDPQKGPMATQTLRGMLEPLHWRGDRATMNDFNPAFVGLMGTEDIGPIAGKPAGLSAADMELFRQFALEIGFPPNPHRKVDDTTPCGPRSTDPGCEVQVHGSLFAGNPTEGATLFDTLPVNTLQPCVSCHAHPFGAAAGALGGVEPEEPAPPEAAALFFGTADGSPHNDLKIAHLRNAYDKFGPVWAGPGGLPPDAKIGFGMTHDGSFPDIFHFLSQNVFSFSNTTQLRDVAAFVLHFPTGTKPAVGRQVTLPQGTPPTGSAQDEALLQSLVALGDLNDSERHCELVVGTIAGGRPRSYHLAGGLWATDLSGEPALTLLALRQAAQAPISFTCATLGSGQRLGGNRDEDVRLDGDDCNDADAGTWAPPATVSGFTLEAPAPLLGWDGQAASAGPSIRFDVLSGTLSQLRSTGIGATGCVAWDLESPSYSDVRSDPSPGDAYYYLIRAHNVCGVGPLGPGLEPLEALDCTP